MKRNVETCSGCKYFVKSPSNEAREERYMCLCVFGTEMLRECIRIVIEKSNGDYFLLVDKETFENGTLPKDCQLLAEYLLMEWNSDEKKN